MQLFPSILICMQFYSSIQICMQRYPSIQICMQQYAIACSNMQLYATIRNFLGVLWRQSGRRSRGASLSDGGKDS
jgi:hypothetical protein